MSVCKPFKYALAYFARVCMSHLTGQKASSLLIILITIRMLVRDYHGTHDVVQSNFQIKTGVSLKHGAHVVPSGNQKCVY